MRSAGPSLQLQTILVLAATLVCLPQRALADEVDTCIAAAERGEPLKKAGRLREARADLGGCVREVCPRVVRDACREMTAAIDDAMPCRRAVLNVAFNSAPTS